MKATEFWKNFKLGEELSISGTFIYNGLRRFHELRHLEHADELFEVLYSLAVGFERLLKIAVVMLEHNDSVNQEAFEKSLITHSHPELLNRIRSQAKINLGPQHNDFLALLARFYKQIRYGRFSLDSARDFDRERKELLDFLGKHLHVTFPEHDFITGALNDDRFRKFVRGVALKISTSLYEIIYCRAGELNMYTYETRHGSKAQTVFLGKADIPAEDVLWKELLVFLMNSKTSSGYLGFLRSIEPLGFDPGLVADYLDCFQSDAAKSLVTDELEYLYGELPEKGERLKLMSIIGSPGLHFPDDEDDQAAESDEENDPEPNNE